MTQHKRITLATGYAHDAAALALAEGAPHHALRRLADALRGAKSASVTPVDALQDAIGGAAAALADLPPAAADAAHRAIHHADAAAARAERRTPDPAADLADASACATFAADDARHAGDDAIADAFADLADALAVAEDAAYGDADAVTARDALAAAIRHAIQTNADAYAPGRTHPEGTHAYRTALTAHADARTEATE